MHRLLIAALAGRQGAAHEERVGLRNPAPMRLAQGREALAAVQALATAADLLPFAGQPRVDDFRLFVVAERAMHQFE